ncbi:aldo/keto reductase [Streptomyces sp. NPDC021100]|uniref:aldo/keto reductase n=1 Tax=Streptomyces sp. NPDC021100 TaxID=3365114 RepID=UPI0037A9A910
MGEGAEAAVARLRFFSYMVVGQGALTGRYGPAHPLPKGSSRAAVYNGIPLRLRALTGRMGAIGENRGASAADVATAWAIAKGTTPITGVTQVGYVDRVVRARGIELADEEITELEAPADTADVDTRGWWECEMQQWMELKQGPRKGPRPFPGAPREAGHGEHARLALLLPVDTEER